MLDVVAKVNNDVGQKYRACGEWLCEQGEFAESLIERIPVGKDEEGDKRIGRCHAQRQSHLPDAGPVQPTTTPHAPDLVAGDHQSGGHANTNQIAEKVLYLEQFHLSGQAL